MSDRTIRSDPWPDEGDAAGYKDFKPLTRQEAQALRATQPSFSPWRVVVLQAVVVSMRAAAMMAMRIIVQILRVQTFYIHRYS